MQKILILEDDPSLAKTLIGSLGSRTAQAAAVHSVEDFYTYIERKKVDVCVLDRMINGEDALDAVGFLHDLYPKAKVLFLSKKSAVIDRIRGLEEGADDYLAKPFSLAELRLRVRKLLGTQKLPVQKKGIALGELRFIPEQGMLCTPEKTILLRRREVEIVQCLSQSLNSFVSREEVVRRLWPIAFEPSESTIDVYVRRLRQKLGRYHSVLETRRGFGYRLVTGDGEDGGDGRALAGA